MSTVHHNYSLKKYNTFGIECFSKQFARFNSEEELIALLNSKEIDKRQLFILGGGSNILFINDYDGVILHNNIKGISEVNISQNDVKLSIGSGEVWDDIVQYAVKKNYYGIENLSLIPGSVGAAPIQNIGAYGVELENVLHSVEGIFIDSLKQKVYLNNECNFGYRESIFKKELKGKFIVTKVNLILSKQKKINLTYGSLDSYLRSANIDEPNIQNIRDAVVFIRTSKLPDPKKLGNAGSFFKNPKVNVSELEVIKTNYPDIVAFPYDENVYKISAGWMIEKCGLKGKRVGDVGTHIDQALVIVNYGGASGSEILKFAKTIQQNVYDKFGIKLEPEVNIINNNRDLL
ncbi:MAG: UDP-N-acetylmuramate dehydrogenase [Ignavibacteriales bacterium]|nr:UDP-N-acetylmuramate dehydrogenase [Melioribacteraceae bacterium]RJP58822.1 MAG: UDP-N-acetylmuramate dehydrogenase [Ignavibacteriales bacterium]